MVKTFAYEREKHNTMLYIITFSNHEAVAIWCESCHEQPFCRFTIVQRCSEIAFFTTYEALKLLQQAM